MIAGIVCEYNPFHTGHLYHLEKTKQIGADYIVCVMSGNYVQRGECAFLDKWNRAETAVRCGADVVIDLPVPWAVASGETFARGSIALLAQFGVDVISFGSETDDAGKLFTAAESVDDEKVSITLAENMSSGMSYPLALSSAVEKHYSSEIADIISSPNSTLAVEYIRQIRKYKGVSAFPVRREGAAHDSENTECCFASASRLRKAVENREDISSFLPEECRKILFSQLGDGFAPCLMQNNERAILSSLRELDKERYTEYVSDTQGLASRIFESVRTATNLEDLYSSAKSKNYTHSRIRREILNLYLRIEKEASEGTPPYIRILAVSKKGLSLLSSAKKNSAIPIVTKHGEMQNLDDRSKRIYEIQCASTDKFALFSPEVTPCGAEQKKSMLIIE